MLFGLYGLLLYKKRKKGEKVGYVSFNKRAKTTGKCNRLARLGIPAWKLG